MNLIFSKAYKHYVLMMLMLVFALNFTDRALVTILLQPIKEDLGLSDTQLGFLTGIAFGLFYAILGLPIARWADRGSRVTITSIAIGLWGVTVMSCLFVANFIQLVVARVAAAVGEAGCMPPTYSLVGDYFPAPAERTRAMAVYWLGNPLSSLIGHVVGGRLNEYFGWRLTFFLMGVPALLLAVLIKVTITEPRMRASREWIPERQLPRMTNVLAILWRQRSSRHLCAAIILVFTVGLGLAPWYGAFMIRRYGMGTAELGIWFGLVFGLGGVAGTWLGGYVASRWFAHDARTQMRLSAVMFALVVPCVSLFALLPQKQQALIALVPMNVVFTFCLGPAFALMQRLVIDEMRATALAVTMLLANLIGFGIGPLVVGALSDWLKPILADNSLRYAILTTSSIALWAAYHFWRVGRTVQKDLTAVANRAQTIADESRCVEAL